MVYFTAAYVKKQRFTMSIKNGGVITNDGFLECIEFVQCTVYNARWETMHCKPGYNNI